LAFVTSFLQAQEKFNYNTEGLTPKYLVVEVDSVSKSELYKRAINWIKENYENPDEVIKTSIDDKMIRFTGVQLQGFYRTTLVGKAYHHVRYTISISFKEGRYKLEPISIEDKYEDGGYWLEVDLNNSKKYFRKNGKARGEYKFYPLLIGKLLNDMNQSIYEYLKTGGQSKDSDEDDW
jgi:hypothetical protein